MMGVLPLLGSLSLGAQVNKIVKRDKKMKLIHHPALQRGHADHGWLKAHHSFSFANYYDPAKMGYGQLRVLNDDSIAPGMGFGTHPHNDMEIVTIPLEGDLEHKDSLGNGTIIKSGEIQVMSAGTGIQHSEFNPNADQEVKLLQIWVKPGKKGVKPRYDQIALDSEREKNVMHQIVSPSPEDDGVWVNQETWFNLGDFDKDTELTLPVKGEHHGVYFFVIEGGAEVAGQVLGKRDGLGVSGTTAIPMSVKEGSRILAMTVPM